jgi:GT2 family glycosyltransferase
MNKVLKQIEFCDRPTVAIILLNWHGSQDTVTCIDSLDKLSYANFRIIVVDNGSTDDSVACIHTAHPEVNIIETGRNLGFSGGCNVGIRMALKEGVKYIWLINNDTMVDSNSLDRMISIAENEPKVGAVGSMIYYMDSPDKVQAWGGGWISFWTGRSGHYLKRVDDSKLHYLTGASMLIRSTVFEDVGLLDEDAFFMYWEDGDLSFRMRKSGWRLAVADDSIVFHKEHAAIDKVGSYLDYYRSESAVRFFYYHSKVPLWPISVAIGGRLLKRIYQRNMTGFAATWRGAVAGMRKGRWKEESGQ